MPEITIQEMTAADLPRVLELARQLGYPDTPEAMGSRFERIRQRPGHTLVTARADGEVIGWMHLCELTPLEAPAAAQISGVVVDEAWRGRGVGRRFIEYAESWAGARGLGRLTLRSRDNRANAHAFYRRRGFAAAKRSVVFEREIGP
ncbi:MAG: N-acetyltransferase family protein [Alphaproteobacteria bacterium]